MSPSLSSIKAVLLERLSTIPHVRVHEEPLDRVDSMHVFPNQVRVRITLTQDELRLGVSGLIQVRDPRDNSNVLAASSSDGGLGSIVLKQDLQTVDTLAGELEWHPSVQEIRRVVAEVLAQEIPQ